MSAPEDALARQLALSGIPYQREYKFNPKRRFKADFWLCETLILVEVEGGVWTQGRHTRGSGYCRDIEKYNLMTLDGFRLLRFTPEMVETGEALRTIEEAIHGG